MIKYEFIVVGGYTKDDFQKEVTRRLNDGWTLHGDSIFKESGSPAWSQPMIKYTHDTKEGYKPGGLGTQTVERI